MAPVGSAFVWRDWRPFLVVASRVFGEVAGFLRAPSPQRAPAFRDFLRGLQRWVLLLERGGRPGEWRAVTHGIGSVSALVFQVDSESAEIALENQGAMGFPAAQGDIPPIAKIFIVERGFISPVWPLWARSALATESIFSACPFLVWGASGDVSLPPPSGRVGSDPPSPLDD